MAYKRSLIYAHKICGEQLSGRGEPCEPVAGTRAKPVPLVSGLVGVPVDYSMVSSGNVSFSVLSAKH